MAGFGNGSSGSLTVSSVTSLSLNTKYQFTDVTIPVGTTLTTNSPTGAVLYILCQGDFTLNGTIDLQNRVNPGNYSWSTTIDGVTYTSPGVKAGGAGGSNNGSLGGVSSLGFGGGGAGSYGGNGGDGAAAFGGGGASGTVSRTTVGDSYFAGSDGTLSGGGSGDAEVNLSAFSGSPSVTLTAISGRGGNAYGANGGDAQVSGSLAGSGTFTYYYFTDGGGGAGGLAGKAGIHLVIKANRIVLNGTILTAGGPGWAGGSGGRSYQNVSSGTWSSGNPPTLEVAGGSGGGGGGGGNGGNLYLVYADSLTDSSIVSLSGSSGGTGGTSPTGGVGGSAGTAGITGTKSIQRVVLLSETVTGGGVGTGAYEYSFEAIVETVTGRGVASYNSVYQSLPGKDYEYRVFDKTGTFLGIWDSVTSPFSYMQALNQTPSELTVDLARSPDNRTQKLDSLLDTLGAVITDTTGSPILVPTSTSNSVGTGTDVDYGYLIDVYAFYGGYETLLDTDGAVILDTNNDPILVPFGFPNGRRVYSGYIAEYELTYGDQAGVKVTVVPHATRQNHYIFMSGSNTTVPYSSADPVQMARDATDNAQTQGSIITYTPASMPLSGTVSSYDFKLQTAKEVVDKSIELLPDGYYSFVDPGANLQYLLQKGTTADHTFYYGKHITELKIRRSGTNLVNKVYYMGGDPGSGVNLYKYYEDTTSQANYGPGLLRLSDSRVTLATSAQALSQRQINEFKDPKYRSTVTITDAVYDIESVQLGDMVAFKNFGSFVDALLLQVVQVNRSSHKVALDLDMLPPMGAKRLEEVKRNILSEEVRDIASAPA